MMTIVNSSEQLMDATLHYHDGQEVKAGDHVLYSGRPAQVVVTIRPPAAVAEYDANEWLYLSRGAILRVEGSGLVHIPVMDEDIRFERRGESE
jgi:hypothetical protein